MRRPEIDVTPFGATIDRYILGELREEGENPMATAISTMGLYQALKDVGYPLPEQCRDVSLHLGIDSAVMLHFDVFVNPEQLDKLGQALQLMAKPRMNR